MLPLQRYAKKQKEAVNKIKNCVETKRQELLRFNEHRSRIGGTYPRVETAT